MTSPQEDAEKLDYAARLSGLLLNEATDVIRWFLKDNLPRTVDGKPELQKLLKNHHETFVALRDDEKFEECYFGHEMFDMLYPPNGQVVDDGNLEISLIFTLIRFLCKIKQSTWIWWTEQPQPHQTAPVFDVIRLVRFKEKMQRIVHNYEITMESYAYSLKYVTGIIERLRGYKVSARRWKDDVIQYEEDEAVTKEKKATDLVTIMRWQTLPMKQRNTTYLVLKKNFQNERQNNLEMGMAWDNFISCFGQMKNLDICKINELQSDGRKNHVTKNELETTLLPAEVLNWHLVFDHHWKDMIKSSAAELLKCSQTGPNQTIKNDSNLSTFEKKIYSSVDDKVFIADSAQSSTAETLLREKWKCMAITTFSQVRVFPWNEKDEIEMDDVVIRVSSKEKVQEPLPDWTGMFEKIERSEPLRIAISGQPQYGKTTILHKIAYDCATKNCPKLQSYDFVFYIDLSGVEYDKPYTRIVDCIKKQSLEYGCEISSDVVEDVINARSGAGVLFLLDNADAMKTGEEMSEIIDVIKANQWPLCGIILTINEYNFDDEHADSCTRELISESRTIWQHFRASGFNLNDVIKQVQNDFKAVKCSAAPGLISTSRHFTNLLRVFQRDIYNTLDPSPLVISILCSAWKTAAKERTGRDKSTNKFIMQQTIGHIIGALMESYFDARKSDHTIFELAVLETTFSRYKTLPRWQYKTDDGLNALLDSGVLCLDESTENDTFVHFSSRLLQDYFSARIFCLRKQTESIRKRLNKIADVIRLKHFLLFCCELKTESAEDILEVLSDMVIESKANDRTQLEIRPTLTNLCMQCFNVSMLSHNSTGYRRLTLTLQETDVDATSMTNTLDQNTNSDLIVGDLELTQPHKLSSRTKQSLLKFTSACKPPRTTSGTVFPLLRNFGGARSTSYIKSLSITDITKDAVSFVVAVISNLQFLNKISLIDIAEITREDFKAICTSLKLKQQSKVSPLLSLSISFKIETKFDLFQIPSYEDLGNALEHMPFLEVLSLRPLTFQRFKSLYTSKSIVPIRCVNLSNSNINEAQCMQIVDLLSLSLFVNSLNLSKNPICGGLIRCRNAFENFRSLQVINLQECCLSSNSLTALSTCLTEPRLARNLTSLNLRANHIDDQVALLSLTRSLGKLRYLSELDLSLNFLRNRIICVLAAQFCNLVHLRKLRLDYVQMKEAGFSALRSNLIYLEKLEVLSLGENSLCSDSLKIISTKLNMPARKTLAELTISGLSVDVPMNISKKDLRQAASSLWSFKNLRVFDLTNTILDYSDTVTLLEAAENHSTLTVMRLSDRLIPLSSSERKTWKCLEIV